MAMGVWTGMSTCSQLELFAHLSVSQYIILQLGIQIVLGWSPLLCTSLFAGFLIYSSQRIKIAIANVDHNLTSRLRWELPEMVFYCCNSDVKVI